MEEDDDYGMQYSEDSNSEPDADLENLYYQSKLLKEEQPVQALEYFRHVIEMQGVVKGEWGFKALKQMIKINITLKNFRESLKCYKEMLTYLRTSITKNQGEKAINGILEFTSTSSSSSNEKEWLQAFYETTLVSLKDTKNDGLWFKVNCKLGKICFDRREYSKLRIILRELKEVCTLPDGSEDLTKGNQLLEIYALEIQMSTIRQNTVQLRNLYERALRVQSAIPHPLIMSTVRECGGQMHLRADEYELAYADYFEAFKNYDEAGSPRRIDCLKYLILTSMLMGSIIDPIDSQEVKPYQNDPQIKPLRELLIAFQSNNTVNFENVFRQNRHAFLDDVFIKEHIASLILAVRSKALVKLIKPYRSIKLAFISLSLHITSEETEDLVTQCILNQTIDGRVDEVRQCLILNATRVELQYTAFQRLVNRINNLHNAVSRRILNSGYNHNP